MNNEQMDGDYQKIDLTEMISGVLRSARHLMRQGILLMIGLAVLFGLRGWRSYRPQYEATASFTVRVSNPFYATQQHYNAAAAEQMAMTFPYILSSSALSQQVMEQLQIPAMPAIQVSVMGQTNIITLKVRSGDPELSDRVLHCVMELYPSVAEFVIGPTTLSLISESGQPQAPINNRNTPHDVLKGAVLGGMLWAVLSLLYWSSHRTVSNEEELGRLVNLECLGRIPTVRGFGSRKNPELCPILSDGSDKFGFNEAIRLMRVRVEREMDRENRRVLVVTSTIADEGKTTLSVNLALSLAQKQKRVLLVDCDLRNPSVAQSMGKKPQLGLGDYLQNKCKLYEIMDHSDHEFLYTICGCKPLSRPEQLLHSDAMKDLIASARKSFDYVILDTPPCALMADATELLALADGALLSVRQNFACRQQILEGVQILSDSHKPLLGCVMNMNIPRIGKGGSYGAYGYYGHYGSYGSYGTHSHKKKDSPRS